MNTTSPLQSTAAAGARVTLVHDYLLVMRGAERTFAAIADLYAGAPVYTLLYDRAGTGGRFDAHPVRTSALQRLGLRQAGFRQLLALYPWAVGRLRLPPSEVVLSSSSAFAHGVRAPAGALHICYCHSPFRYAWHERERALAEVARPVRPALGRVLDRIARWDVRASSAVDVYIANSQLTRERIKRNYGRDAVVIHPPVETHRFAPGRPGESLLVVSEIVPHKRVAVALEAARRVAVPITIVGSGPQHETLRKAYPEARFLGRASHERLAELYASARAVVVPSPEEFGIVAVEAQAAGRPVIAAACGGALETVIDGTTGRLVALDDVDALARAIDELDRLPFDPGEAAANAERFSVEVFHEHLARLVGEALADRQGTRAGRP